MNVRARIFLHPIIKFYISGQIWNIKRRELCDIFSGHSGEICALDYSPNGHSIVSGSMDGSAIVWDLHTFNHKCLRTSEPAAKIKEFSNAAGITSVSVSSCSHFVAGGCLDNSIHIWSMKTGELKAKLEGHEDSVYAVRFMNDAKRLVSGGLDRSVRIWDVSSLADDGKNTKSGLMRGTCPIIKIYRGHSVRLLARTTIISFLLRSQQGLRSDGCLRQSVHRLGCQRL